jgi:hypothetical protein
VTEGNGKSCCSCAADFLLAKPAVIAYLFDPWIRASGSDPSAFPNPECGAVAQLGECLTGSQEVTSSILVSSTNKINNLQPLRIPKFLPDSLCLQIACIFFSVQNGRCNPAHPRNPV